MLKNAFWTWAGAVGLLVLTLTQGSCAAEDPNCPVVSGVYEPLYLFRSGNCAPLTNTYRVPFDGGNSGVNMSLQRFTNVDVTTEIVLKGCTVRMTQTIADKMGAPQLQIDGEALDIENENKITGMVDLVQYDANQQIACSGQFDATFTKQVGTTGAAARQ